MSADAASLLPHGSDGSEIFSGRAQEEEDDLVQALPRGLLFGSFICLYGGFCLKLLNTAQHLPDVVRFNPHAVDNLGNVLVGGGCVLLVVLAVLLVTRADLRPTCDRDGLCKVNRIAGYLYQCTVGAVLLSTPYLVFYFYDAKEFRPHEAAWFAAGVFTMLTVTYSLREVTKHMQNWLLPALQKNICRILLMAPVYAVCCFLQMRLLQQGVYIGAIREFYEALTVYSFMRLMTDFMDTLASHQQPRATVAELLKGPNGAGCERLEHKFPVSLLQKAGLIKPWEILSPDGSSPFLEITKLGVLQYVPVAIFCAVGACFFELIGVFHESKITLKGGWLYLCLLRNLSQFVALYSLVMFYHGAKNLLEPLRPLTKFLSVKLIIFFTFWQKIVLILLKHFDMLPIHNLYEDEFSDKNISTWGDDVSSPEIFNDLASAGIQNLLICIEMFIAAVAHRHVFSYRDYRPRPGTSGTAEDARRPFARAFSDMISVDDVTSEVGQFTSQQIQTVADGLSAQISKLPFRDKEDAAYTPLVGDGPVRDSQTPLRVSGSG